MGGESRSRDPATSPGLSHDNLVVHGLWIGPRLSKMELLTIRSFLRHGHEFHLWLYDDLETPLPERVVLEDASRIIPRSGLFKKRELDAEAGVGRGSLGPFSDLFRYKVLYERGGYWSDMDVTCLRPLDFPDPYLFRAHRVGVVGNVMKCPIHSPLMGQTYEQAARVADERSAWLLTNRILSSNVERLGLSGFIHPDICNEDSWAYAVRHLAQGDPPLPATWYFIHWMNELWRTLAADDGRFKGHRLTDHAPDKDLPGTGSALARLYREHGLADDVDAPPPRRPETRQPPTADVASELHINILIPSLALGGAERVVQETLLGLARRGATARLFLLYAASPSYAIEGEGRLTVHRLDGSDLDSALRKVAAEVIASPVNALYTHMIAAPLLARLGAWGMKTVPVVHNSRPSWQDPPRAFDQPGVPFVVAVSEAVAAQLREDGCPRPVVTLRHELQRRFFPGPVREDRRAVRETYGVSDETLLIGMVGHFKSQKAYPRAVQVLAGVRRQRPAKLLILGGWDHDWGNGRAEYAETRRLAIEMGVAADLLTPGLVADPEPYYAAFDVFLNTSLYEGLSVSTLEAVGSGCPIVSADAGGNREALPADAVVVDDSSDVAAYVDGVARALEAGRRPVAAPVADPDLVPRLWCLLGQQAALGVGPSRGGTLFLTDKLGIDGASGFLIDLVRRLPADVGRWVGVTGKVSCAGHLDVLDRAGVLTLSFHDTTGRLDQAERVLFLVHRLGVRCVCFWDLDAGLKLLLAKVLTPGTVRLIDVGTGPRLFDEIVRPSSLQKRLCFTAADYFQRLDRFVATRAGDAPPWPTPGLVVLPIGEPIAAETLAARRVGRKPRSDRPGMRTFQRRFPRLGK